MEIEIRFAGGSRVEASVGNHTVRTDQPVGDGGEDSAPSPFALFLASLGTCAGYFVLRFCQSRGISTEGLGLTQRLEVDPTSHRISGITIDIRTPEGFPEKYREALVRAADQCAVKRTLLHPPEIRVAAAPA